MEPDVILTQTIKDKLTDFLEHTDSSKQSKEIRDLIEEDAGIIPFRLIKYVFDRHQSKGKKKEYLNEWLEGSTLHLPAYEPPPRNPELEARIQRLKAEQANREYKEMVRSVDKEQKLDTDSFGKEVKAMNSHILSFINFVVTVGGAFAFGYKATEYTFSGNNAFLAQMMTGLLFASVVFCADLYFLIREAS